MQTRRSFITQVAATAAVSAFSAPFIRAADKAGSAQLVTGPEGHKYEMIHDWLTAPEGLVWGDTQGLAQDSQGLIYVAHTVNSSSMRPEAIVVYDAKGKFVRAFGSQFQGGGHGLEELVAAQDLVLRERAPGVSVEEIRAKTAGKLIVPAEVPEMPSISSRSSSTTMASPK